MMVLDSIRRRARHVVGPFLGAAALVYFGYHTIQGERGLLAWWSLRHEIREAEAHLARVEEQKLTLERRTQLLRPDSLDRDMLEERARLMLNLGRDSELTVIERR